MTRGIIEHSAITQVKLGCTERWHLGARTVSLAAPRQVERDVGGLRPIIGMFICKWSCASVTCVRLTDSSLPERGICLPRLLLLSA